MNRLQDLLSCDCLRVLSNIRAWNITVRTAHIATMGILLGGHAFEVPKSKLIVSLWLCVATGVVLAVLETGLRFVWFHQGRGLMTVAKLVLIGSVPFFWDYRLPILLTVVVIASIGSHMPARLRYYSLVYGRVIRDCAGPGVSQLAEDQDDEPVSG